MKGKYFVITITFVIVFSMSKTLLATPFSFSTFSPKGLEILPTTDFGVGFSAPSLGNEGSTPIALGTFDPITGNVIDGDAVLIAFLNIGNAPVKQINLVGGGLITVDQTNRISSGIIESPGVILPPHTSPHMGFTIGANSHNALIGSRGTFYIGLAMFTSKAQSLDEVPGVTIPIDILIGDKTAFIHHDSLSDSKTYSSIGGATQAVIPEPSTFLFFVSGLMGIVVIGRKKLFKRVKNHNTEDS